MQHHFPSYLSQVIASLKKLPGVGQKSAERYAFDLLSWPKEELARFQKTLQTLAEDAQSCAECGCLVEGQRCSFCTEERRASGSLCITTSAKEVFFLEETGEYRGLYHVLGSKLSPLDGVTPEDLGIQQIKKRIEDYQIQEVILAIDSTVEGDATSLLLKEELHTCGPLKVSRLAFGLPMGSSLEFVDGNTLALALSGRKALI